MVYYGLHWSERVRVAPTIELTSEHEAELTRLARSKLTSVRLALRAPLFGPMVMFGLGGLFLEALKDAQLAPAPLDCKHARALVQAIRGAALLDGARGSAAADIDRIAELLAGWGISSSPMRHASPRST